MWGWGGVVEGIRHIPQFTSEGNSVLSPDLVPSIGNVSLLTHSLVPGLHTQLTQTQTGCTRNGIIYAHNTAPLEQH